MQMFCVCWVCTNLGKILIYALLQTLQRHGVYSAVDGTVLYKKTLKSFEIRVGHSPGFGLPSVAILPLCAESDVKQYTYIHTYKALMQDVNVLIVIYVK